MLCVTLKKFEPLFEQLTAVQAYPAGHRGEDRVWLCLHVMGTCDMAVTCYI
jgi:hypothetical protein